MFPPFSTLELGPLHEHFVGEHTLRVSPSQLHGLHTGDFWLPAYFAHWNGKSLALSDDFAGRLEGAAPAASRFEAVGADDVPLRYGKTYEFRVRLADISGGGPPVNAEPVVPGEAPITTCHFRRFVPPNAVSVTNAQPVDPVNPQTSYNVRRPVLGYPALVYTAFDHAEQALIRRHYRIYPMENYLVSCYKLESRSDSASGRTATRRPSAPDVSVVFPRH